MTKPPTVLIDGFFLGKPYGFGRFIGELCRALGTSRAEMEFVVAVPDRIDVAGLPQYGRLRWHAVREANFILWEQLTMPRLARTLACDVIHFPYNTRALRTGMPTVTTVHDLLFLHDKVPLRAAKDYLASRYAKLVFAAATRRSDAVVSVSHTTQRALQALGVPATTVYNTVDGFKADHSPDPSPFGRRYLLHRGGYAVHRNTARVVEAFRAARAQLGDVDLKVIGAPAGAQRWQTEGDASIQFLPRVSDQELATLYAGSACVLATSLEEGFGLPIIEGFGFGAPVITSDVDPMREIAGDAAVLVDPASVEAIARAMVAVVTDPALAASLTARGHARAAAFSGEQVAAGMIAVYHACAGRRPSQG